MTQEADHDPAVVRVSTRPVYSNPWMTVREDEVVRSDGSQGIYAFVDKADFALIIPSDRNGFWLVEQYRYPIGRRSWEFPQGTFNGGGTGTQEDLARAELEEELGLRAGRLIHLGRFSCAAGMANQWLDIFLATDLVPGDISREQTEQDMRERWVSRSDFESMVLRGEIVDDATVAAFGLFLLHGG